MGVKGLGFRLAQTRERDQPCLQALRCTCLPRRPTPAGRCVVSGAPVAGNASQPALRLVDAPAGLNAAGTPQPRGDGGPPEGWGMAGSLAAAGPDPKAAAASAAGGAARGGVDAAPDGGGGALPATRKQLLVEMARRGTPLHTDGLQLYNVTELVARAGDNAGEGALWKQALLAVLEEEGGPADVRVMTAVQ